MLKEREKNLLAICDQLFDHVVAFTQDMVAQYAVLHQEQGVLKVVENRFRELGFMPQRVSMDTISQHSAAAPVDWDYSDKYNLAVVLQPESQGKTLVLNGHLDVVPADPHSMWTFPPTQAVVKDGWLYGRGSGDMQSGVAAMIYAACAVQQAGISLKKPLCIQTVVEEECSGNGALSCIDQGYDGDFVLIPEPFGPTIYAGQIGVLWFSMEVYGSPAHVLNTGAGCNAIMEIYQAISRLQLLEKKLNSEFNRVPPYCQMANPFNLNLGKIQGGNWASSVAANAKAECRIGFPVDMTVIDIKSLVEETLAPVQQMLTEKGAQLTIEYGGFQSQGHIVDTDHAGIQLLRDCHKSLTDQEPDSYYATCTTDLRAFHSCHGTVGTCYGPVARNIHGVDECVNLESVRHVLKAYALFIARWQEQD